MKKRIQFTRDELELINNMAGIASAAAWGEGDYASWRMPHHTAAIFDSMREKVWALIERRVKSGPPGGPVPPARKKRASLGARFRRL